MDGSFISFRAVSASFLLAPLLAGCSTFTQISNERIRGYTTLFAEKLEETVEATTDGVVASVEDTIGSLLDTGIAELKVKLGAAVGEKIDTWFDENLPDIDPENLEPGELEALLEKHPELAEIITVGVEELIEEEEEEVCDFCENDDCQKLVIHAAGENYNGWPLMRAYVDDAKVGEWEVSNDAKADEFIDFEVVGNAGASGPRKIEIEFANDACCGPNKEDRNLVVDWFEVNGVRVEAESPLVRYRRANDEIPSQERMAWNGKLVFEIPEGALAPAAACAGVDLDELAEKQRIARRSVGDGCQKISIFAGGHEYKGWPIMNLFVDGKKVASWEADADYRKEEVAEFSFSGDFGTEGPKKIEVEFENDLYDGTPETDRNLFVDAIEVNGVRFEAEVSAGKEMMLSAGRLTFDTKEKAPAPEECR